MSSSGLILGGLKVSFESTLTIFLCILSGVVLVKWPKDAPILDPKNLRPLSRLALSVCMPCTLIANMANGLHWDVLANGSYIFFFAVVQLLISYGVALLLRKCFRSYIPDYYVSYFPFCFMITNSFSVPVAILKIYCELESSNSVECISEVLTYTTFFTAVAPQLVLWSFVYPILCELEFVEYDASQIQFENEKVSFVQSSELPPWEDSLKDALSGTSMKGNYISVSPALDSMVGLFDRRCFISRYQSKADESTPLLSIPSKSETKSPRSIHKIVSFSDQDLRSLGNRNVLNDSPDPSGCLKIFDETEIKEAPLPKVRSVPNFSRRNSSFNCVDGPLLHEIFAEMSIVVDHRGLERDVTFRRESRITSPGGLRAFDVEQESYCESFMQLSWVQGLKKTALQPCIIAIFLGSFIGLVKPLQVIFKPDSSFFFIGSAIHLFGTPAVGLLISVMAGSLGNAYHTWSPGEEPIQLIALVVFGKMILCPLFTFIFLYIFATFVFPLEPLLMTVILLESAMPTANVLIGVAIELSHEQESRTTAVVMLAQYCFGIISFTIVLTCSTIFTESF